MHERTYCVYLLSNHTRTVLYTGVTNNLKRRVFEHKQKAVPGFTTKYRVGDLMYYEVAGDPYTAISREKQIKNYSRARKMALIHAVNPAMRDLYDEL